MREDEDKAGMGVAGKGGAGVADSETVVGALGLTVRR